MKIRPPLRQLSLGLALLLPTSLQALEVHEWGTFTVLLGSNGQAANWYQPYSDIAELPAFTRNSFLMMKSTVGAAKVRMETPVIYFYPKEEMDVRVKVMFQNGSITERFPAASNESRGLFERPKHEPGVITSNVRFQERYDDFVTINAPIMTEWHGKLLPPSHTNAKLIPSVAGHKGENYGAAREVPDAWIFHSSTGVMKTQGQPDIHPLEKFIFYRGVGQNVPPYHVSMPDEQRSTSRVTRHQQTHSRSLSVCGMVARHGLASQVFLNPRSTRIVKRRSLFLKPACPSTKPIRNSALSF